ncbi:hypothetical protein JKF63_00416 [Porcisia hertigi]|uniref:Uncharacterized protein n=1 Tax=Porcisia hertigi TaxID=2761500 RepID=A0A836KX23_9TRYP|nr:hypothetical protein JKF63_00416 [Porcisia hertigi]
MHRDRIRVRPAGGVGPLSGTNSVSHLGLGSLDGSSSDRGAAALRRSESSFVTPSGQGWNAQSLSSESNADRSGEIWRYTRRIANLAYCTVGGIFKGICTISDGKAKTFQDSCASAKAIASPATPPNAHAMYAETPPHDYSAAGQLSEETHKADTIELRQPRHDKLQYQVPQPHRPITGSARQIPEPPLVHPVVQETPQCYITVNQYFTAPERSIYPVVSAHSDQAAMYRGAHSSQSRASLLTAPSPLPSLQKRPRLAISSAAAAVSRVRKAPKVAPETDASQTSLSNAPSAIPLGSQDNSLTVPIASLGTTRLFDNTKLSLNDDAQVSAKFSTPSPVDAPTAKAPLLGVKMAATAATAVSNNFIFGAKSTGGAPARSVPAAPAFGAPKTNPFVKAGPPAVIPDDGGFAPGADSDDDDKGTKSTAESTAPAKASFSFGPSGSKPTFGATPLPSTGAPVNPFSFSAKPVEAAPARSVPAAPAFGAPKTNSFVKAGPPAVIPDDGGFAPGADSDDDDKGTKSTAESTAPAKASFSFGPSGSKPTFGATPLPSTGAPVNPFSFSAKPVEAAPARSVPAAPAFGAPKTNPFVKAGPPAVIPDDGGFAPGADSDDDDKGTKSTAESTAPAKASFSFGPSGSKPTFGATPLPSTGAPVNPFSFSAKPVEAAPARSVPAAPAFGAPKTNPFVKAGPPAVIPDDGGFAPGADSDDDDKGKTEGAPSGVGNGAFSFNLSASNTKSSFGSGVAFGGSATVGTGGGASGTVASPFSFSNPTSTESFGASSSSGFRFPTSK